MSTCVWRQLLVLYGRLLWGAGLSAFGWKARGTMLTATQCLQRRCLSHTIASKSIWLPNAIFGIHNRMSSPVILRHLNEFKEILDVYNHSDHAKDVLARTKLVLLVGITGGGRNTVIRELQKTGEYYFIVSDTTRPPKIRDGKLEEHGVQYYFRSEEEVLHDLREGEFLEAAMIHNQQVSGISIRELKKAHESHKIALTDIEYVGADNVSRLKPDGVFIFMVPPSFDEWKRRLMHREEMSEEELANRIESARKELSFALKQSYYTFVVNDTVEQATKDVHSLATGKDYDPAHDVEARKIAERLLDELNS